jgi:hypothetical protein
LEINSTEIYTLFFQGFTSKEKERGKDIRSLLAALATKMMQHNKLESKGGQQPDWDTQRLSY